MLYFSHTTGSCSKPPVNLYCDLNNLIYKLYKIENLKTRKVKVFKAEGSIMQTLTQHASFKNRK